MATVRQKKLARLIVENAIAKKPRNKKQLVVSSGYTEVQAKAKMHEITESKGVKEELALLGFTEDAAKKVVEEIMNDKDVDPSARLKATDQVFKIHGTYAPEKSITAHIQLSDEKRSKSNDLFSRALGD